MTSPMQEAAPRLGLPLPVLGALSLLAAPRVVLHDLDVATGPAVAGLLAVGPAVVWIVVTLRAQVQRPWQPLLVIGLCYGVILAVGHNIFWEEAYAGNAPELGGSLEGAWDAEEQEPFLRLAVAFSSVFTGALTGLVCGGCASLVRRISTRARR